MRHWLPFALAARGEAQPERRSRRLGIAFAPFQPGPTRPAQRQLMWFMVRVERGSKHFEADSRVANHVLLCDSSDLVISGRSHGVESYRFEARKGNETFILAEFAGADAKKPMTEQFLALAKQMGAVIATT